MVGGRPEQLGATQNSYRGCQNSWEVRTVGGLVKTVGAGHYSWSWSEIMGVGQNSWGLVITVGDWLEKLGA